MEKKRIEIELRSDEYQEIIQQSPRWIVRSGIFLVFGVIVLLLIGSYFFRYPEVIKANIVVSVIPEKQSQIVGLILLPVQFTRKVAVGQKVNIQFEDYPYREYGIIRGSVNSISLVPNTENYVVEVEMPQDMKTNYDIPLKFSHEMKGSAEIITSDLRLIERFFKPVKSLLRHRVSAAN